MNKSMTEEKEKEYEVEAITGVFLMDKRTGKMYISDELRRKRRGKK